MKPTRIQYFYAQGWPLKIWLTLSPLVFGAVAVRTCEPSLATLKNWRLLFSLIGIFLIWAMLGFFVGLVLGSIILPPLYHYRAIRNGGPFKPGDVVQILVGPHRGRVVRVHSLQEHSVQVELGKQAREGFDSVFTPEQLLREMEAVPGMSLDA